MIPKFRCFDKDTKTMHEVVSIDFRDWRVYYEAYGFRNYWNKNVILMQSTGVYDKHGVEIFEGDIIQQVHAYDYSILEIETDYLEPFEVKKGNYVQGKWIAEKVDGENYSVVRYVFGKDVKVIGNVHQNAELLEDV